MKPSKPNIKIILGLLLLTGIITCQQEESHDGLFRDFDGTFIYCDRINSIYQIFTLDKYSLEQITHSSTNKISPQCFPDGNTILYLSDDVDGLRFHVISKDGTKDTALIYTAPEPLDYLYYPTIQLSPDGNKVVLSRFDSILVYSISEGMIMEKISSLPCMTQYKHVTWAPNSGNFSCTCPGPDQENHMFVYNIPTGTFNVLDDTLGGYVIKQSWTFDSEYVGFTAGGDIYLSDPAGAELQKIISTSNYWESALSFSSIENKLVYERADSLYDLVLYDFVTGQTNVLVNDKAYISDPLLWIEDGKYVVYEYGEESFGFSDYRLYDFESGASYPFLREKVNDLQWTKN